MVRIRFGGGMPRYDASVRTNQPSARFPAIRNHHSALSTQHWTLAFIPHDPRLDRQLRFLLELDRLKGILRQTRVLDGDRQENSAEHSWHLALCAAVLAEHAPPGTDVGRVMRMVLVHDVVEIDAGDAFCYDPAANVGKEERERLAAKRIFGLLPAEQAVSCGPCGRSSRWGRPRTRASRWRWTGCSPCC